MAKYQGKEINENNDLRKYIIERLRRYWSPDEISGRMKAENQLFYASKCFMLLKQLSMIGSTASGDRDIVPGFIPKDTGREKGIKRKQKRP